MKKLFTLIALGALTACGPAATGDDPRNRTGDEGPLTWRVVDQDGGHAAFLSRPGAAPDIVLWCRSNGELTLRAHVFENPNARPDLLLSTSGGMIAFDSVRRQGGIRAGDRKLVEGSVILQDPKLPKILAAAADLTVTSGGVDYKVSQTDPSGALAQFSTACFGTKAHSKAQQ